MLLKDNPRPCWVHVANAAGDERWFQKLYLEGPFLSKQVQQRAPILCCVNDPCHLPNRERLAEVTEFRVKPAVVDSIRVR
jgi:hypothetical protein